tara:strand:- start:45516 stop:46385 length:870 start_codon:yes stop_codon:yes gene_type:complete
MRYEVLEKSLTVREAELVLSAPIGSLDQYFSAAGRIPILTQEEEIQLANKLRESNDLEAAQKLVLSHLRFVVHIAKGYSGYGLPIGDLIQEGNIGLMKAVKRFDPNVGVRLVAFAVHWIRAEIHEYVLKNWKLVKVATTKAQRKLFFNLRKAKSNLGWLSNDETKSIAKDLGVTEKEVSEMEKRLSAHDVSFDPSPLGEDEASPSLMIPSDNSDPAELIEAEDSYRHSYKKLDKALNKLDGRSKDIVARRWLKNSKDTLHDLADEYNISAERIRQIESNALRKLKNLIA